jgi:hypothetical protein
MLLAPHLHPPRIMQAYAVGRAVEGDEENFPRMIDADSKPLSVIDLNSNHQARIADPLHSRRLGHPAPCTPIAAHTRAAAGTSDAKLFLDQQVASCWHDFYLTLLLRCLAAIPALGARMHARAALR